MWASELNEFNTGPNIVNGTCGGGPFFLGMGEGRSCEEFSMKVGYSSVVLKIDGWTFKVLGNWVYGSISGPAHRLDLAIKGNGDAASRYLPHGMVGQSFASLAVRHGKRDFYPLSGRMRTTAMAEGAIEGDASMYEVAGPFATDFRFSRFSAALVAVPSGLLTDGDASAISDAAEGLGAISDAEAAYAPPPMRRLAEMAPCAPPSAPPCPPDMQAEVRDGVVSRCRALRRFADCCMPPNEVADKHPDWNLPSGGWDEVKESRLVGLPVN